MHDILIEKRGDDMFVTGLLALTCGERWSLEGVVPKVQLFIAPVTKADFLGFRTTAASLDASVGGMAYLNWGLH
jgi:hypothetical protein